MKSYKQVKSLNYKGVFQSWRNGKHIGWVGRVFANGKYSSAFKKTEGEAAKAVDMKLIELGKKPVNILKRVL